MKIKKEVLLMIYNKEFIKTFNENEYKEALKNKDYLSKLKNSYLNMYSSDEGVIIEATEILFKESLDHYVYRELNSNLMFIDTIEMKNYVNYIIDIYNSSTIEFNTNVVLRDTNLRKKIVDKYLSKYRDTLEKRSEYDNDLCDKIIDKIKENKQVSQSEVNYVCEYLAKLNYPRLEENEVLLKYIFGEMKNCNLKLSYQVKDLILSYIPYFYQNGYTKNVRIVLGNTDRKRKIKGPGHSSSVGNYIALSKEFFANVDLNSIENSNVERLKQGNDITFFMIVAFHELTHQIQNENSKKDIYDGQGMAYIISKILDRELKDYGRNHDSDGIEIDANLNGWQNAMSFFDKFYSGHDKERLTKNCYINSKTSSIRRVFAYKKDSDGNYLPYDEYDISNLVNIIKNKPDYITEYPMLKRFFNSKGQPRLSFMINNNLYTDETAMEFVHYFTRTNGIEKMVDTLDKRKLNSNEVNNLLNNIYYYIIGSLKKVDRLNYVLYHKSAGEYRNNEEFSEEVSNKLGLLHSRNALNAYKKALPLFNKLSNMYPDCRKYVEWIINVLNSKFDYNLNDYENINVTNKIL